MYIFDVTSLYIVPYYDYSDLTGRGEVRYAIITPATNISLCNQVNNYLSNSTGSSVSVEWILWAYWYDVCPYDDNYCNNTEVNSFNNN